MTFKLHDENGESGVTIWPGGAVTQVFADGREQALSRDEFLLWPWVLEWVRRGHSLMELNGKLVRVCGRLAWTEDLPVSRA